jgi:hypothetical protein
MVHSAIAIHWFFNRQATFCPQSIAGMRASGFRQYLPKINTNRMLNPWQAFGSRRFVHVG